ncbi:uncharacterized protein SOCE26_010540 [Sorangium cellulosum]|uniref:Uncharacterized protein n=1 Tax=Sorangium cellulosum TaxID=56 RepID=A0A2L0EK56_SORCE|nr:hypothetical protein [Sorangium cellulosum]AUX39659.1 uncharacterized protein SOCE26_010540 [Sorangium cellulosum]
MSTRADHMYTRALQVLVALGIAVDAALAIPAVLAPESLASALYLPQILSFKADIWQRGFGVMQLLLASMYLPALVSPLRDRYLTAAAITSRLLLGLFWYWAVTFADYSRAYLVFAYLEGSLGLLQAALYVAVLRREHLRAR